jgi:Ca2+-binding RTX toxin-like protein
VKRILFVILAIVTALTIPSAVSAATAPPNITIDFTGDTAGAVPNGFASVASPSVTFYDTSGADLLVVDLGDAQTHGQSLLIGSDDTSALEIRLAHPTTALSLAFGNDDPGYVTTADKAVLTLYRGSTQVAKKTVLVNANDAMDQRIGQKQGPLFNRATFQYVYANGTPANLTEVVDDISINPLCTVAGTEHADTLHGTSGNDIICGGGGADTISGLLGNDAVFAGPGADLVYGGDGADVLLGGLGNDTLLGQKGADMLRGEQGNDHLDGGLGIDDCNGGLGADIVKNC